MRECELLMAIETPALRQSKEILREKLLYAILSGAAGFELS